jgi:hypothetical protein
MHLHVVKLSAVEVDFASACAAAEMLACERVGDRKMTCACVAPSHIKPSRFSSR